MSILKGANCKNEKEHRFKDKSKITKAKHVIYQGQKWVNVYKTNEIK